MKQKQFVIIDDSSEIIRETFPNIQIQNYDKEFDQAIAAALQSVFPEDQIINLPTDEISNFFQTQSDNMFRISLLPQWLYGVHAEQAISMTRVYEWLAWIAENKHNTLLTRTGWPIEWELDKINTLRNWKVAIIDDGLFSGSAVKLILTKLKSAWMKAEDIHIIVANNFSGKDNIDWSPVFALHTINTAELRDVFEARDVMMGWKHSGGTTRIVWELFGITYTRPEIAHGKSSIPYHHANHYCKQIIQANIDLMEWIWLLDMELRELLAQSGRKSLLHLHSNQTTTISQALRAELDLLTH